MTYIYISIALTGLLYLDALLEHIECKEEKNNDKN